ncbi:mCG146288, partial [Mus musculus]
TFRGMGNELSALKCHICLLVYVSQVPEAQQTPRVHKEIPSVGIHRCMTKSQFPASFYAGCLKNCYLFKRGRVINFTSVFSQMPFPHMLCNC